MKSAGERSGRLEPVHQVHADIVRLPTGCWQVSVRCKGGRYDVGCYEDHAHALEVQQQLEASLRDSVLGEAIERTLVELFSA